MASIKFQRKQIEREIKLTSEIIEKISLFGTSVESIDKDSITIEVLPNRPDLLSASGFLRALKSFLGKQGFINYKVNSPEKNFKVKIENSVKNIRPYTACAIVKNLKFNDEKIKEIIELQEKLHTTMGRNRKKAAIGIYPLEKITLPISYKACLPSDIKFIPLEATEEMNGLQILQRHPAGREYSYLLEGKEKFPVFIDAKNRILSMPPIINSHETGKITENTKDVFIECSGFDFNVLNKILNIIVTTLADMNGKIYAMALEYDKKIITPDLSPEKIKISLENANKLLGLQLNERDIEKLLSKMGFNYSKGIVSVPAWRTDILHEVDIIEDIAIAYGYENFKPEIPNISTIGAESQNSIKIKKILEILIGLGLTEISTYHLIKQEEAQMHKLKCIELENAKTEYKLLRPNLLIPALRILTENKDNEYPQKIFEIGSVFHKNDKEETGIKENIHLLIACSPANFTSLKQILDYLFNTLGKTYSLKETSKAELIDGRTGAIIHNGKEIGYIGELHPETLKNWNMKMPVAVIEIEADEFLN